MQPWYSLWFGETYKTLYPHRDSAEARHQIQFLLQATGCQPDWRILDIGCGAGRHLAAFAAAGFPHSHGVDLSAILLKDASTAGHSVARADMRCLPFRPGYFNLIASLFTSFGYFAKSEEDLATLAGFADRLKPGGYLFLDLPDRAHVLANLVPRDERQLNAITMVQERTIETHDDGDQVVKRIHLRNAAGNTEIFEERVRLYDLAVLEKAAQARQLHITQIFGDEKGAPYRPGLSSRMALLLRRQG
jgi:SAM-dependent methyltransferase